MSVPRTNHSCIRDEVWRAKVAQDIYEICAKNGHFRAFALVWLTWTDYLHPDGHFQNTVLARLKQLVRFDDVIERESMREKRTQTDATSFNKTHEAVHAFFATGTKRSDDGLISEAGVNRFERHREVAGAPTDSPHDVATCGGPGEACCAGASPCSQNGCCDPESNTCATQGTACSAPGSVCSTGVCQACGASGFACCAGNVCNGGGCCDTGACVAAGDVCERHGVLRGNLRRRMRRRDRALLRWEHMHRRPRVRGGYLRRVRRRQRDVLRGEYVHRRLL